MKVWKVAQEKLFSKIRFASNNKKLKNTTAHLHLETLEVRSLLASHPIANAPDVDYQITADWSTGHTAELTLTNDEASSFTDWQLEFDYSGQIDNLWNATVRNLGGGRYAITPPSWDNTLDAGESLAIGLCASGSSGISNITFNGTGDTAPDTPDTPPGDEVGDDPLTAPPVDSAPNTPSVSVLTNSEVGGYDITVNLWSGEAAESWKLYENGELIGQEPFDSATSTPQSASIHISDRTYGVFYYQVEVSNAAGSTTSDVTTHVVGGASQIEIDQVDAEGQALQVTIDQGTGEYQLSIGDSVGATFSAATNNSRVLSAQIVDGDTLQITGLDAGRASVKLTDQATGERRYIGFRVRTAEGELPGLPDYLTVGSVSEDSEGDLAFWHDFDNGDPLTGKYVDSRYIYLNGGPVNGWRTWGDRVGSYLRESLKLGMIPQFVYYNIPDGGESYATNNEHIASTEYMEAYFTDLKFALDTIATEAGDELVQFIMEPDFIGYLMQNAGAPASQLSAMTSAAYSSGVLEAGVDPQFENTVTGLIEAINYTISSHTANVEFGWQFNLWASPGIETPIGSGGIVHLTDTMGMEAGRAAIAREAELIAEYYIDAGVLSYGANFISIDKYGLDAGAENGAAADPASSTWFWNSDHWNNYLLIIETLSDVSEKEMILWQLPAGHINESLAPNPYDADGTFDVLPNTTRQYEDSAPTFFLGDSFRATGTRFDHFSSNDSGDPKLSVDGSTITWGSHMEEARDAGIRQILFGAGVGISTDSIGSEPTDDYWWITQVQEYYQNPVPMDRSTIEPPADPPADPVDPPPDGVDPPVDETPTDPPVDPPANTDPDQLPTITISDAQVTEGDSGFVLATFTIALSESSSDMVSVDFYTMSNTASSGTDFAQTEGTVTFAPGETSKTIDVRVYGDLVVENDERFEVVLTTPSGAIFETTPDEPIDEPVSNPSDSVTSGSDFSFEITGSWDTGYVSQWTYAPETAAGTWQVTIQLDGEINSIWNAEILSEDGSVYVIGNGEYNGDVAAGQTAVFGFEATGSSASIEILSGSVPQNPSEDDDSVATTGWETHIIGDSIAVGLGYQNPAALGYAQVGSNPTTIYNEIIAGGYQLDGARVLLSSGIMNNTIDFAGVENQLQYLTDQGASVRLVGAADGNYDSHNEQLAALAQQYGVTFMGGFTPGADGVHPPNYQYEDLYAAVSAIDSGENDELPDDGTGASNGTLSGFGTILNDDVADPVDPPTDPVDPPVDPPADPPADPVDPPTNDDPVYVSDIEVIEGDSGSSQAIFTVNRVATDAPLTLTYETEDGSALAGEDYLATSGTVSLAAGESTAEIAVTILGDIEFEADESFALHVRSLESDQPPASTPQDPVEVPVVAAYYPEWGIYGRNYQIGDVPGDDLSHFIYAFANLTAEGEMVLFDSFAATEKRFSAAESVSGEADLWSYPADDPRSEQTVWGNFNQVAQLKAKYPHLRTSIALGGWTLSGNFSSVCATSEGRETLASSIYDFLGTYTMFDGIDFDWEYPGGGGLRGNSESPQDGANYASVLELVREKLDQLGTENDRYYEITLASPGGPDKVANFNVSGVNQYVDFFNVMTYDFHGTWENTTGHQAALMNDPAGYDIETAVNLYLDAGVSPEKIILGAPAYTRAWSGVADGGDNGYAESASGAAGGTFETGNYDYKDLASQYLSGTSDWELNWDDDAQAAYLYSASEGIFSSFETPGSISLKSEWAQDAGLGGMMFWDLSNDAGGDESLIGAAADSWFAGKTFAEITSASDLVFDTIYGGNGIFDPVVQSNTTPSTPPPITGDDAAVDLTATGTILNDDNTTPPVEPPVDDPPVDETPVDEPPADPPADVNSPAPDLIVGDSIAVGLSAVEPSITSDAVSGRQPSLIYNALLSLGDAVNGAKIMLSTGIMNASNADGYLDSWEQGEREYIRQQFDLLSEKGAAVLLVGAADPYVEENQFLAELSAEYGNVTFTGSFVPGADGVHPGEWPSTSLYEQVTTYAWPGAVDTDPDPVTPPMDDHDGHDPMDPPASSGDYIDITSWGTFHDSNDNSEHDELVGGRTAITTEATEAYNNLRAFFGLSALTIEDVGEWAFANELTNNTEAWGNDIQGVGLYYAMQGAKVGWITDETYDPQILADIQRTARTVEDPAEMKAAVMEMVRQFGYEGFADYLELYGIEDTFINTLKMEPHYGGWMHGRTHGWRSIEGVAIAHDVNHLTVLSSDQTQPFMNDTFDWPQWDALDVSSSGVIEYFQSMVVLGNPVGENMEFAPAPTQPPVTDPPVDETPVDETPADPGNTSSVTFALAETWDSGFTGNLTIRNAGPDAINGWTLEFTFAGQIDAIWNASITSQEGDRYVITNADWNAQVAAGGEVTFGFTVVGSQDSLPTDIVFTGKDNLA